MPTTTPSDHAQADLRVEDVKVSQQFIDRLNVLGAPLPWGSNDDNGEVYDADGNVICDVGDYISNGSASVAEMIVIAVNTCGSFRATRRDDEKRD